MLQPCLATLTKRQAEAIYLAANTRRETHVEPLQVIKPHCLLENQRPDLSLLSLFGFVVQTFFYTSYMFLDASNAMVYSNMKLQTDKKKFTLKGNLLLKRCISMVGTFPRGLGTFIAIPTARTTDWVNKFIILPPKGPCLR